MTFGRVVGWPHTTAVSSFDENKKDPAVGWRTAKLHGGSFDFPDGTLPEFDVWDGN